MVMPLALITDPFHMGIDQHNGVCLPLHGLRVHLSPVDRLFVRTSPVEIKFPVIIRKQIRIPEREGSRYLLKGLCQRVFRPEK